MADPYSPWGASQRLIDAIAQSPDRAALDTPARLLIKAWAECGDALDTTRFDAKGPEPVRRAHAYERKRR